MRDNGRRWTIALFRDLAERFDVRDPRKLHQTARRAPRATRPHSQRPGLLRLVDRSPTGCIARVSGQRRAQGPTHEAACAPALGECARLSISGALSRLSGLSAGRQMSVKMKAVSEKLSFLFLFCAALKSTSRQASVFQRPSLSQGRHTKAVCRRLQSTHSERSSDAPPKPSTVAASLGFRSARPTSTLENCQFCYFSHARTLEAQNVQEIESDKNPK